MNSRSCLRLLFSLSLVLCVLFSNGFYVHASDINNHENNTIVIDLTDATFVDPNSPLLMDDFTVNESDCNSFASAYASSQNSGSYSTLQWKDIRDDILYSQGNYYYRLLYVLKSDVSAGTYDIIFNIGVPSYFTLSSNADLHFYDRSSNFITYSPESTKICTNDVYTIQYKDVEITEDFAQLRLDFYGYISTTQTSKFTPYNFEFEEVDTTKGLLASIIEWLTDIRDSIVDLPGKIKTALTGLFDLVVNAITNLGNFLIEGIKGLFVPSEEDITIMQDRWNSLLEDRFGALYQAIDIIHDYAAAFTSSEQNTITMPEVSIPLGQDEFVFGGYTVQVVPDGFTVIIDTLKLMISIISTFAFVNAMKSRLERLIGGSDNI